MPSLICLIALAGFAQQAAPQPPAGIPVGTPVEVELQQTLSSSTLHAGQEIAFTVVAPVAVDGTTVIPAGTAVQGEVTMLQKAGAFRKSAALDLAFKPLQLQDGSVVQLEFPRPRVRSTGKEKTATGIAGVAASPFLLYYFPLIPFAIAENTKKGAGFTIRAGERYRVYVVHPQSASPPPPAATAPERTP